MLLDYPKHDELRRFSARLNEVYAGYPALYEVDKSWEGFRWLNVDDCSRSSIAFMRKCEDKKSYVVCVFNFTPVRYDGFVIGLPEKGKLVEILNSDETEFGGSGIKNGTVKSIDEPFLDLPCSAKLTLPPLSAQYFEFLPLKEK